MKSILIQTALIISILFCVAVATNGLAIFHNGSDFYEAVRGVVGKVKDGI